MSDINCDSILRFAGKDYEVRVSLNLIDEFQDKFNTKFFNIAKLLDDDKTIYKVTRWVLWKMITESIMRHNLRTGEHERIPQEWEIGDQLTFEEVLRLAVDVKSVVVECMPQDEEKDGIIEESPR